MSSATTKNLVYDFMALSNSQLFTVSTDRGSFINGTKYLYDGMVESHGHTNIIRPNKTA